MRCARPQGQPPLACHGWPPVMRQPAVIFSEFWRRNPTDWHFRSITSGMIPASLPSVALTVQAAGTRHDGAKKCRSAAGVRQQHGHCRLAGDQPGLVGSAFAVTDLNSPLQGIRKSLAFRRWIRMKCLLLDPLLPERKGGEAAGQSIDTAFSRNLKPPAQAGGDFKREL